MGIDEVWELAHSLAQSTGAPVSVVAPPPPVTWIANDKHLFSQLVESVLGPEWLVETRIGRSPEALARELLSLAERHAQVGLKRLRCASAMGNKVFAAAEIEGRPVDDVAATVRRFLDRTQWQGDEDVQVVAWEKVDHSPSTQLWIPPREMGAPRLDGVFEQLLEGRAQGLRGQPALDATASGQRPQPETAPSPSLSPSSRSAMSAAAPSTSCSSATPTVNFSCTSRSATAAGVERASP